MVRKTRIPALACTCEICGYPWYSISKTLPDACPNRECRSREWNGVKVRRKRDKIDLPKPPRIRGNDDDNF